MENIVVVGGAGGLGLVITRLYASFKDTRVIVGDIDETAGKQISSGSQNIYFHPVDIVVPQSLEKFKDWIANQFTSITHLVNVVGGLLPEETRGFRNTTLSAIKYSNDLNFLGPAYLTSTLLPLIEKDPGENRTITFVGSIDALQDWGTPIYGPAKRGIIQFVENSTTEFGRQGIRINSVSPGTIKPDPSRIEPDQKMWRDKDMYSKMLASTALGFLPTNGDIANEVCLLTHVRRCVTGQNIVVDCGQSVKARYIPV